MKRREKVTKLSSKEEIGKRNQKRKEEEHIKGIEENISEIEQRRNKCKRNHKGKEEKTESSLECIPKTLFNE